MPWLERVWSRGRASSKTMSSKQWQAQSFQGTLDDVFFSLDIFGWYYLLVIILVFLEVEDAKKGLQLECWLLLF